MDKENKNMSGAELLFKCLREEKVDYIFGYPGGKVLKLYECLYDVDFLEHVLVRHEQGAAHAAEGYSRVTGKPGVVLVTSGPGATNVVTGIADAYMDSIPLVVFTGQVPLHLIGNDAFQEADIVGITRPITKHSFLVRNVEELAETIKKAFYIATTGRPGPVLVDLPVDVLDNVTEFSYPDSIDLKGYKPMYIGHQSQIKKAAHILKKAQKPVLYVGGGVIMSGGASELFSFAKENNLPVTMTLQGLGAFPGNDPQSIGMLGMHGNYYANRAVSECDLLIALGARFDDRVTGKIDEFSINSYKIHVDIDPTAIDKNVVVDLPIVGDVKHVIAELAAEMNGKKPEVTEWWKEINHWREEFPSAYEENDGKLRAEYVIERLSDKTKGDAIIVTDVGQNQMWTALHYKFQNPRSFVTSGGLGTMGFSLPASVGACFGLKSLGEANRPVISISGDGGFQMNIQELVTAVAYKLPVKFIIINNSVLGMVRQWQELFFSEKYSFTDLTNSNPDFVKVAEAFGVKAYSTSSPDEVDSLLEKMLEYNAGPVLVEFKVVKEQMVLPMIPPAGATKNSILRNIKDSID